jgi:hypothetical protein
MVGIGSIWLRIGTGGRLMWTRWWNSEFHKMLGSSRVAAQLAASQEGLSSMSEWGIATFTWCDGRKLWKFTNQIFLCPGRYSNTGFPEYETSVISTFSKHCCEGAVYCVSFILYFRVSFPRFLRFVHFHRHYYAGVVWLSTSINCFLSSENQNLSGHTSPLRRKIVVRN